METIIYTRSDGQVFAVAEIEDGLLQSIFPTDMAEHSQTHTSMEDAKKYIDGVIAGDPTP